MAALAAAGGSSELEAHLDSLAMEHKKDTLPAAAADDVDDGCDADDSADPSSSSSSTTLDAAEKRRLANKRKKEKAKQRKQKERPTTTTTTATSSPPSSSSSSLSSSPSKSSSSASAELRSLESSFPTLSMHRFFALPLQLSFDLTQGRHVVTSERLLAGATLFTQLPYACVVCEPHVASLCHRCLSPSPVFLKCSSCHFAHYCSTTCKTTHARLHAHECKALLLLREQHTQSTSTTTTTTSFRLVLRMLAHRLEEQTAIDKHREKMKGKKGATADSLPSSLQVGLTFPDVLSLQSHVDELSAQERLSLLSHLSSFAGLLPPSLRSPDDLPLLLRLLLTIHINAHDVVDVNKQRLAVGLFTAAALMNHSCAPSALFHFGDKGEMTMKAMGGVAAGGELTYAYCDVYQPRGKRWDTLRAVYKMDGCMCERCRVPMDASWDRFIGGQQCNHCRDGLVVLVKGEGGDGDGRCDRCSRVFPASQLGDSADDADVVVQQALALYSSQQHALVVRTLQERLLSPPTSSSDVRPHPHSVVSFQCYFMLMSALSSLGEWAKVCVYTGLAKECFVGAGLEGHPEYADVLVVEGQARGKEGRKEEGRALLERARENRERLYGRKHALTKDVQLKINQL